MGSTNYKELIAYQRSYEVVKIIYKITKEFPKEELYGLTSQLRRACVSVPSNIAEGYRRGSKEYIHFLRIALGSTAEIETMLSLCKDLHYGNVSDLEQAYVLNEEATKLLVTYINRLGKKG